MGTKGRRNVKKPKKEQKKPVTKEEEENKKGEAFLILFSPFSLKGESGTNPRKGIAQSSVLFNLSVSNKNSLCDIYFEREGELFMPKPI